VDSQLGEAKTITIYLARRKSDLFAENYDEGHLKGVIMDI